jgi:hypothetical protein
MAETTASPTKRLSFEQLAAARKSTQAVSDILEKQLLVYLDTLRSLLVPERLLGKLAGSKFDAPGADKVLTELQENYRRLPGKPFDFPKEFETEWLVEIGVKLDLHRWEYSREIAAESGKRSILITSPNRWILAYGPGYSVSQAVQSLARRQDRRGIDQLRQFVVNALVMQALLSRSSGLISVLTDLRYDVCAQPHPGLNGLPVVAILPSFPPTRSLPLQLNCLVSMRSSN